MYVVILAGGGGTRLWPLSTPDRPKPFLPLLPDGQSLFQRTIRRLDGPELGEPSLSPPFDPEGDLFVIVDGRFVELARAQARAIVPGLPADQVIAEPAGRNTAAAIALATVAIDRGDDEVMAVLPADQLMSPDKEGVFRGVLANAERELAREFKDIPDALVTLGIQPDRPATEYGYLRPDLTRGQTRSLAAYPAVEIVESPLMAFIEKPDAAAAADLIREPGVAWNAGMFLWRRRAIRGALMRYPKAAPIWAAVEAGQGSGDLAGAYARLEPVATSIDYAVMEPAAAAGQVVMGSMDVGWSDLGSWHALLAALDPVDPPDIEGRVIPPGERIDVGANDLLVDREGWPGPGALRLAHGPATMGPFDRPTALLQGAAGHERVVADLLERTGGQGGSPA